MRVKCTHDSATHLDPCYLSVGWLRSSTFHVSMGKLYSVYGMRLLGPGLHYLVVDDTGYVGWKPSTIFDVVDSVIPSSWVFSGGANMRPNEENAIWGYELLCNSYKHHNGLVSSEGSEIAIFELQKERMDMECRQQHLLALIESHSSALDERTANELRELAYWSEIDVALQRLEAGLQPQGVALSKEILQKFE